MLHPVLRAFCCTLHPEMVISGQRGADWSKTKIWFHTLGHKITVVSSGVLFCSTRMRTKMCLSLFKNETYSIVMDRVEVCKCISVVCLHMISMSNICNFIITPQSHWQSTVSTVKKTRKYQGIVFVRPTKMMSWIKYW